MPTIHDFLICSYAIHMVWEKKYTFKVAKNWKFLVTICIYNSWVAYVLIALTIFGICKSH